MSRFSQVVIIGAGFSGLTMACQLQEKLKQFDYTIYDRAQDIGGTWCANRYPGCAVDIPAALYSLSFAPYPGFSKLCPSQQEVLAYMHSVANRYGVHKHVVCQTEWVSSQWQEASQTWLVLLRDVTSGKVFEHECKILISAVGALTNPNPCNLPGVDSFRGRVVHTARWPEDLSLQGKDVVVVGNGASASQLIPAVIDQTKSITQFIRTPQYYIANDNMDINAFWKSVLRWVPGLLLLLRFLIFLYLETAMMMIGLDEQGSRSRLVAANGSKDYVKGSTPEKYWSLLVPKYEIACKRRIFDKAKYIPCLQNEKLHLTNDPIVEVRESSVVTKSGKSYPADTIVLATGFSMTHWNVEMRGKGNRTREDHWKEFGYVEAFQTVGMNGFPNFFYILGPNSGRAHTSTIFAMENFTHLILRVIRPVLEGRASAVEVKRESEQRFNEQLHTALEKTVFTDSCGSWFNDKQTGRNWFIYPWSSFQMWYSTHMAGLSDWSYETTPTETFSRPEKSLLDLCKCREIRSPHQGIYHY